MPELISTALTLTRLATENGVAVTVGVLAAVLLIASAATSLALAEARNAASRTIAAEPSAPKADAPEPRRRRRLFSPASR
ncbi:MAG: hypothetical protein QM611_04425 [Microbacterium sp.]|uniref:hypothetical protein n=1 Tax=Microbacterium sp. TaxID=51671 RepID=UPI0039E6B023